MQSLTIFENPVELIPSKFQSLNFKKESEPVLTEIDMKYSKCKRYSALEVRHEYENEVCKAKKEYLQKLEMAYTDFANDYPAAVKMDEILGVGENNTDQASKNTKDSSKSKSCPIHGCDARTVRLKRHLSSIHPGLSEKRQSYACKISYFAHKSTSYKRI